VVVLSVPWSVLPEALEQAGSLVDKIVVDTTTQFGSGPIPAHGQTAAAFNRGAYAWSAVGEVLQNAHVRVPGRGS
jgi:predicted dinucleotide-binding enzyme